MMYWNDGSWGWGSWLLMTISMLVFWGLVAWVALSVVRSSGRREHAERTPTPEDLLAERFARGEIDQAEYQQRAATLRNERPGTR